MIDDRLHMPTRSCLSIFARPTSFVEPATEWVRTLDALGILFSLTRFSKHPCCRLPLTRKTPLDQTPHDIRTVLEWQALWWARKLLQPGHHVWAVVTFIRIMTLLLSGRSSAIKFVLTDQTSGKLERCQVSTIWLLLSLLAFKGTGIWNLVLSPSLWRVNKRLLHESY